MRNISRIIPQPVKVGIAGPATVTEAVAEVPVPPLVEVTALVVLVFTP